MRKLLEKLEVLNCIKTLQAGGTLLYPTDTIWGLGCDATRPECVSKIYRLKNREEDKSFIILVDSVERLAEYVEEVPPMAYDLINAMAGTPLTIVYPKGKNLAHNVLGNDGSVAIRIVKDRFCTRVMEQFGKPLVSTSANISGFPPPLKLSDVSDQILTDVDHIAVVNEEVNYGDVRPSRIIKLEPNGMFTVIRE